MSYNTAKELQEFYTLVNEIEKIIKRGQKHINAIDNKLHNVVEIDANIQIVTSNRRTNKKRVTTTKKSKVA